MNFAFNVPSSNCNKLWLQALFILTLLILQPEASVITLGFLLPYNATANISTGPLALGKDFASALLVAVEAITNDSTLLPGHQVTFVWNDTQCNEEISVKAMLYQLDKGVQGFIGPACMCKTTAKLAATFNIPMISYMCTNEKLSDKTLYSTFARTVPPMSRLSPPVHALMKHFNWNRVGIITQNSQHWSQWNALVSSLKQEGVLVSTPQIMAYGVHYNESGLSRDFEHLLHRAAQESRGKKKIHHFCCWISLEN